MRIRMAHVLYVVRMVQGACTPLPHYRPNGKSRLWIMVVVVVKVKETRTWTLNLKTATSQHPTRTSKHRQHASNMQHASASMDTKATQNTEAPCNMRFAFCVLRFGFGRFARCALLF
jgi:hypothetical protein